jgi:uncharacterized protein (DUF1684 family)
MIKICDHFIYVLYLIEIHIKTYTIMKTKTILIGGVIIAAVVIAVAYVINRPGANDCEDADVIYRTEKNTWIIEKTYTPFDLGQIARYKGLDYYPIDCDYVFEGTLKKDPKPETLTTVNGSLMQLDMYGTVSFTYDMKEYSLDIFEAGNLPEFKKFPGTYFIPFQDNTAILPDSTTYKYGRYLIVEIPARGDKMSLDFNMAINSFNAYNGLFDAVLPPRQNRVAAPLPVGERKYEDRTH